MTGKGKAKPWTSRGVSVTEDVIERLAKEAEEGYEPTQLRRRVGRPTKGAEPAEVVPVRLDERLRRALESRAKAEGLSVSDVIRRALKDHAGSPENVSSPAGLGPELPMPSSPHELDRIEHGLASTHLDSSLFERCAQDLLTEIYPGLSPIPGGTDWGRDADVHPATEEPPVRLLATSSRTREGVRKNLLAGLRSMAKHGVPFRRIVLANPASLTQSERHSLGESAKKFGAVVDAIFDRGFFASRLRRDGQWRQRLLGLSPYPITLSRLPPDLAESPWAALPLVGRNAELQVISATEGDLVISGSPGVGKTRLLAEIEGAFFVDRDATRDRLADDLRWARPAVIVVDDAGRSEELIRSLVRLRQVEPSLHEYRIAAACWPDEAEKVRAWVRVDKSLDIGLLVREDLDQLLVAMGITGQLARGEILDQAEGRPGWAVALGDLLLRARDHASLLSGRALLGQVQGYLRRSAVGPEAMHLLATISLLGEVSESELDDLAKEIELARPKLVDLLAAAAASGLIDVTSGYDHGLRDNIRFYCVRPPMLAAVLVAEHIFSDQVPGVDVGKLLERWPKRLGAVAEATINAVLVGATHARAYAGRIFRLTVVSDHVGPDARVQVARLYARVDDSAADEVLSLARTEFEGWMRGSHERVEQIERVVELAYLIARWHLKDRAMELLLDAAVCDSRPTNPYPGHPLRRLAELVQDFHPELPTPREQRKLVASVANRWIEDDPSPARWIVYGHATATALSIRLRSALAAPGNPRTIQLIETVADSSEMERIYQEIWPSVRDRLADAPPATLRIVIETTEDWLRVGGGYDRPFGRSHPQPSIDAARRLGERLFRDLVPLVGNHPGLASYLRDVAGQFELSVDVALSPEHEAFFADIDRDEDWEAAARRLEEQIKGMVMPWADEDRATVIQRLVTLRIELELSTVRWPDRVWIACTALAERVDDPIAWADTALELGLFPQAEPFLGHALDRGQKISERQAERYLGNLVARGPAIHYFLAAESETHRDVVLRHLGPEDYGILKSMFFRASLSAEQARRLLTRPVGSARGAAAAAMFAKGRGEREGWTPGELENEWLDAIQQLDPTSTIGFQDYEATELMSYLTQRYPDVATDWVSSRLDAGIASREVYRALPHGAWEALHLLPHNSKDELWSRFTHPSVRWLLGREMVGDDVDWLAHAMDEGLISPEKAAETYNGLGIHPPLEDLARLLVPRGVDPRRVAYFAQSGTWTGEESHRYSQMIEQFSAMAQSAEESVASVGRAGVEIFAAARDEALQEERKERIRGEL